MDKIGEIDLAVVLGSGLSDLLESLGQFNTIGYNDIGMPVAALAGHAGHALVGRWHGKRILAFAGRVHGYQGFAARDVTRNMAIAAERGAKGVLLTNAAGGLNPNYHVGDLMMVADHINLTGMNPLVGPGVVDPFLNMTDAYSPRLRSFARTIDPALHEGVYVGMVGPTYETPAEARFLRSIGGDAVGMSTVLETIAARSYRMEVFAVSVITNALGATGVSHEEVTVAASKTAPRLGALLDGLVERL